MEGAAGTILLKEQAELRFRIKVLIAGRMSGRV